MEKTIKVEGMMCQHCEKHCKAELEKIDGIVEAVCDHDKNQAVLKLSKEVSESDIENAVKEAGYKYCGTL